jgi:monooxygenase
MAAPEYFDVLIMGAGLSGVDAAHHLQTLCPAKSYVILEQRERIGGTWDLFRYPGIRSDSDMLTMGYSFRPWTRPQSISPGGDIREYIESTAREEGMLPHIRFRHAIRRASWSSEDAQWTVEAVRTLAGGAEEAVTIRCNFLFCCAGYYRYSSGYLPDFAGIDRFQGRIVHPQAWPEDLDYSGKRVLIVGSGATAVTLIPSMAKTAAHVTMLQRSPGYVVSLPARDVIFNFLRRILPNSLAYRICRWKNVILAFYFYQFAVRFPKVATKGILDKVRAALGPDFDVETHFTPRYNPWEQRLCLIPDSDMFDVIKAGRASVVTGAIDTFTEKGIRLASGEELEADLIVTATGLVMQFFGGIEMEVDGKAVDAGQALAYKGVMLSDVPNFASVFGYINASWTLKADLVCAYVCRLLRYMDRRQVRQVTPVRAPGDVSVAPFVERFSSGYVARAIDRLPRQGARRPWRVFQNYFRDWVSLKWESFNDGVLRFSNPTAGQQVQRQSPVASVPAASSR